MAAYSETLNYDKLNDDKLNDDKLNDDKLNDDKLYESKSLVPIIDLTVKSENWSINGRLIMISSLNFYSKNSVEGVQLSFTIKDSSYEIECLTWDSRARILNATLKFNKVYTISAAKIVASVYNKRVIKLHFDDRTDIIQNNIDLAPFYEMKFTPLNNVQEMQIGTVLDIMATIRTHYPQTVIGSSKKNKERSNLPVTLNDGTLKNKKTINCVFSDRESEVLYDHLIHDANPIIVATSVYVSRFQDKNYLNTTSNSIITINPHFSVNLSKLEEVTIWKSENNNTTRDIEDFDTFCLNGHFKTSKLLLSEENNHSLRFHFINDFQILNLQNMTLYKSCPQTGCHNSMKEILPAKTPKKFYCFKCEETKTEYTNRITMRALIAENDDTDHLEWVNLYENQIDKLFRHLLPLNENIYSITKTVSQQLKDLFDNNKHEFIACCEQVMFLKKHHRRVFQIEMCAYNTKDENNKITLNFEVSNIHLMLECEHYNVIKRSKSLPNSITSHKLSNIQFESNENINYKDL